jgi:hypothetical protein
MSRIQLDHMHFLVRRLLDYINKALLHFRVDYEVLLAIDVRHGDIEISSLRDRVEERLARVMSKIQCVFVRQVPGEIVACCWCKSCGIDVEVAVLEMILSGIELLQAAADVEK